MRKLCFMRLAALLTALCLVPVAAMAAPGNLYESRGESGHDIFVWKDTGFGSGHYELVQANVNHSYTGDVCSMCGYEKAAEGTQVVNPNYRKSVSLQNDAMKLGYAAIGGVATVEVSGNIRSGYSTKSPVIGKAKEGQTFTVLDCYISTVGGGATWYLIPYNGGRAWISAGLVSVAADEGAGAGTVGSVTDADYGTGFTQTSQGTTIVYPTVTMPPVSTGTVPSQGTSVVYPTFTTPPLASADVPAVAVGRVVTVVQSGYGYTAATTLARVVGQVLVGESYTVQELAYDLNGQSWYSILWNSGRMWIPSYLTNVNR